MCQAKGCEEAGQVIRAEDHVAVPQRTRQALPDSPLNPLQVRDNDHQPAAKLDQPQVFRNDRARVIEMLDESRGIHEVECFGRERRQGKVLADDASRHALQSEIGAQQAASAPGEVSAEHFAAQLPTEIGKYPGPGGPDFEHTEPASTAGVAPQMAAEQADRLEVDVPVKAQPLRTLRFPPVLFPVGDISEPFHASFRAPGPAQQGGRDARAPGGA